MVLPLPPLPTLLNRNTTQMDTSFLPLVTSCWVLLPQAPTYNLYTFLRRREIAKLSPWSLVDMVMLSRALATYTRTIAVEMRKVVSSVRSFGNGARTAMLSVRCRGETRRREVIVDILMLYPRPRV
jgi:hypothetical protein